MRGLESEFKDGSNAIRLELNRLESAGLLESKSEGNKKMFRANINHPLFLDLHNIILKYVGLDQIIHSIVNKVGNLDQVYLTGPLASGVNSEIINLILVGSNIDKTYVSRLSEKAEGIIKKKISYVFFEPKKFMAFQMENSNTLFLIWDKI